LKSQKKVYRIDVDWLLDTDDDAVEQDLKNFPVIETDPIVFESRQDAEKFAQHLRDKFNLSSEIKLVSSDYHQTPEEEAQDEADWPFEFRSQAEQKKICATVLDEIDRNLGFTKFSQLADICMPGASYLVVADALGWLISEGSVHLLPFIYDGQPDGDWQLCFSRVEDSKPKPKKEPSSLANVMEAAQKAVAAAFGPAAVRGKATAPQSQNGATA
jgi:hypothetical protein